MYLYYKNRCIFITITYVGIQAYVSAHVCVYNKHMYNLHAIRYIHHIIHHYIQNTIESRVYGIPMPSCYPTHALYHKANVCIISICYVHKINLESK